MSYLLDTHSFIWLARGDGRLSRRVVELASDPDSSIFLSVVSRWEIELKRRTDPDLLPRPFDELFASSRFLSLDLGFNVPSRLADLPYLHKDPFDRLLIAQTLTEGLTLVSRDSQVRRYDVPLFW